MSRLTGGGALIATILGGINNWSIPFFGVPLTVVSMAALGSFISFAWGKPVERPKLYFLAMASTFLAAISVAVLPPMMGWTWINPKLEAPFAGMLGAVGRFAIPAIIEAIPEIVRKVFRLDKKEEQK